MCRPILPLVFAALVASSFTPALAQEAGDEPSEEREVPACPKAEIASDRAAARSYVLTAAQLKGLTAVNVETVGGLDKTAAHRFYCRLEESDDGAKTYILTTVSASRLFGKYPQVAKAYAGQGLTARDLALWGHLSQWLVFAASPELAAMAPDVAADAKKQLSAQQSAFATQNRAGLRAWFEASKKAGR